MPSLGSAASQIVSQTSPNAPVPRREKTIDPAYLKAARLLLGCYRQGDANDPEVYITAVVRVLSAYPIDVVERVIDPVTGLPSKLKWLPSVPEIRSACEEIHGLQLRIKETHEQIERQLTEREELQRVKASNQETIDEMWADMARRGWKPTEEQQKIRRTVAFNDVALLKTKYGVSDEQWNALPDLPDSAVYWEGKRYSR